MILTNNRTLKLFLALLLALLTAMAFTTIGVQPVSAATGMYVSGTTVYDANGKPFVMRGINHPHAWYKNDLATAIPAIAATGANSVRIVLSNGSQWSKDSLAFIQNIIALCEQYRMIAILEVHDATGSDSYTALDNAVNYWIEMKSALIGKERTVIINIANEWYGTWDASGWANGYKQAIPKLRSAGLDHLLMVDAAGWGQYPASIHTMGKEVLAADPRKNTMFSIHMYEYAGGTADQVRSNIDGVLNQGLAVVVGEFGPKHSNGEVDEATIMSYSQQKGVGWLVWSWYGNSSDLNYLDVATGPSGSLTSWGNTVVNGTNGIKATSALASVFGTGTGGGTTTYVKLQNRASGLYADSWGRTANGNNVALSGSGTSNNQQWVVEAAGTYVKIKNRANGLYLDGMGRTANGSAASFWSGSSSYNQQWTKEDAGSGYVRFKNRATGLYLDTVGRTTAGSDLGQWAYSTSYNQQWKLVNP